MAAIDPGQYPKLKKGAEYLFEYGAKRRMVRGRLIFAQSAEGKFYENDKLMFTKVVARRAAFEPVEKADRWKSWLRPPRAPERLRVYAIHLEAGRFAIHRAGS